MMKDNIKENGWMENNMELHNLQTKMGFINKENGKMENQFNG